MLCFYLRLAISLNCYLDLYILAREEFILSQDFLIGKQQLMRFICVYRNHYRVICKRFLLQLYQETSKKAQDVKIDRFGIHVHVAYTGWKNSVEAKAPSPYGLSRKKQHFCEIKLPKSAPLEPNYNLTRIQT